MRRAISGALFAFVFLVLYSGCGGNADRDPGTAPQATPGKTSKFGAPKLPPPPPRK
jgi:hypothetical protein